MSATFGKLQDATLELHDGLNIIQAPNETGKSTWCAFLLSMLYGVNSRERDKAGSIADKNRYAPWSGASMSGRLDCNADGQDITLLRTTKRASAPMGEFQALYTGTADPIPYLTSATCGEKLLGVTREVYSRGAFIRQNQLTISQSSELERRIASLISSGDEHSSYSEAITLLKKQANRRRHNRTGQLPVLETELGQLKAQLAEATALSERILSLRQQEQALARQEASLQQELTLHRRWEQHLRVQQIQNAEATVTKYQETAEALHRQLEADHIPENSTIAQLRGAIVNLSTARRSLEKARNERDDAMKSLLLADAAVNASPFAGHTPDTARRQLEKNSSPRYSSLTVWGTLSLVATAFLLAYETLLRPVLTAAGQPALGILPTAFVTFAVLICTGWLLRRRNRQKIHAALVKHYGTADQEKLLALIDAYAALLAARDAAQSELDRHSTAADTLYNSISANEQAILLEIRRFAPTAYDLSSADALLRGCAIRRKEVADAEAALREAILRREILSQNATPDVTNIPRPERPKVDVEIELTEVSSTLDHCRSSIQHLTGQLAAWGEPAQTQAEMDALVQQIQQLQSEHDAIRLAMNTLDSANQTMQNRFAPALGKRTAQLFHQLTEGCYQDVVLDRSFSLSTEPTGDHIHRDISLLSAGTADQLYLAARLAICETVSPPEKHIPIVLDDALTNFDDQRCAAALQLLKELARHHQILLFTCHDREASFFSEDKEVAILRLTNAVEKV